MPKGLCNHPSGQIFYSSLVFWPSFMPLTFYAPLYENFPTLFKFAAPLIYSNPSRTFMTSP